MTLSCGGKQIEMFILLEKFDNKHAARASQLATFSILVINLTRFPGDYDILYGTNTKTVCAR